MSTENVLKDRLCQHYRQMGIPNVDSARFASLVDKWVTHSGPEWTVKRLSALATSWKESVASGQRYVVPDGFATRVNRKGVKIFKDRLIHSLFTRDPSSEKNLKIIQGFLRAPTLIKLESISKQQFEKFYTGVTSEMTEEQKIATARLGKRVASISKSIGEDIPQFEVPIAPLSHMSVSSSKRSPYVANVDDCYSTRSSHELFLKTAPRTDIRTKDVLDVLGLDQAWKDIWYQHPHHVSDCVVGEEMKLPINVSSIDDVDLPVGTISFIQEGKCKLRQVANPFLSVQALAEPLKRKLETVSSFMRNVYTFDQDQGRERIAQALRDGHTVYSFDASSFTDRFPYKLQREVLLSFEELGIINDFDLEVMDTVVSKSWQLKMEDGTIKRIRYEAGQPQGFGPSFHLACITHAMVALSSRVPGVHDSFAVVGDDIAIWDPAVAEYYKQHMESIGVEINLQKSMISNEFAEFCGKVISKNGCSESMKVKFLMNEDQLVSALSFYGPRGWKHLSDSERRLATKCLLPEDLGGLGTSFDLGTYTEYLQMLKTDNIQHHRLTKQLQDFLDPVSRCSVEASLEHLAEFYDSLMCNIAPSELHRMYSSSNSPSESNQLFVDHWTGFPTSAFDKMTSRDDNLLASQFNTFSYIWDSAVRSDLEGFVSAFTDKELHRNMKSFSKSAKTDILRVTKQISSKYGYITNTPSRKGFQPRNYVAGPEPDNEPDFKDRLKGRELKSENNKVDKFVFSDEMLAQSNKSKYKEVLDEPSSSNPERQKRVEKTRRTRPKP